eukprot:jgi/Galph1/4086/GphlegSOOS_G2731.1
MKLLVDNDKQYAFPLLFLLSSGQRGIPKSHRCFQSQKKGNLSQGGGKSFLSPFCVTGDFPSFEQVLQTHALEPLRRRSVETVQLNVGLTCNMACSHCHVESSPSRKETMSVEVAERILELVSRSSSVQLVDITGGAPELHSVFRLLTSSLYSMGKKVQDRCNLTVFFEKGQEDLMEFLANHQVDIVASLPCYEPANVRKQRGAGAFEKSIQALQQLNQFGYGEKNSSRQLHLVYNPVDAQLPPNQSDLERVYKQQLFDNFGIRFNRLYCITNVPIKRYRNDLIRKAQLQRYMELLIDSFGPKNVDRVMCLDQIHISYDGTFYDCDFNYAIDLRANDGKTSRDRWTIWDIDELEQVLNHNIRTDQHCFACTAGCGSSCGGSLTTDE